MKYNPPFGSTDPNASYVDKNTPGAIAGSRVPAAGLEEPQREIGHVIDFYLGDGSNFSAQSDADLQQLRKAIALGIQSAVRLAPNRVRFTTPGAFSWTAPSDRGKVPIRIKLWGAGGGGGRAETSSGAAGGGGGAYLEWALTVSPGQVVTGIVGAGGTAGVSGVDAGAGGDTSITVGGSTVTAGGGQGGLNTTNGIAGNSRAGGTPSGSYDIANNGYVSAGALRGYNGSVILYYGGNGGGSPNGGAGGNAGTAQGNSGVAPGGGGGGSAANGSSLDGSVGGRGELWIEY